MSAAMIIQHVEAEAPGAIADAMRRHGSDLRVVRIYAGESVPAALEEASGLVVMGGPMGVGDLDTMPYLRKVLRLIQVALVANVPVLGVCLGSQLVASALGAPVRRGPRKEIGWHRVTLTETASADALFAGVPRAFDAFHWHGDVFDLPLGAAWLASSDATPYQAFRWRDRAYGLLFHLEVDQPAIQRMATTFEHELAEVGLTPAELLATSRDRLTATRLIGERVFERWAALVAARAAGCAKA